MNANHMLRESTDETPITIRLWRLSGSLERGVMPVMRRIPKSPIIG